MIPVEVIGVRKLLEVFRALRVGSQGTVDVVARLGLRSSGAHVRNLVPKTRGTEVVPHEQLTAHTHEIDQSLGADFVRGQALGRESCNPIALSGRDANIRLTGGERQAAAKRIRRKAGVDHHLVAAKAHLESIAAPAAYIEYHRMPRVR